MFTFCSTLCRRYIGSLSSSRAIVCCRREELYVPSSSYLLLLLGEPTNVSQESYPLREGCRCYSGLIAWADSPASVPID